MVDEKRNNLQSIAGQIRDLENKADYGNTERKEQSIKKDVVCLLYTSFIQCVIFSNIGKFCRHGYSDRKCPDRRGKYRAW